MKQLTKTMQFLWNADKYIEDAEREGHSKCAEMWKRIKVDKERHADMLKDMIMTVAVKEGLK